jgi:hypothetical protein
MDWKPWSGTKVVAAPLVIAAYAEGGTVLFL